MKPWLAAAALLIHLGATAQPVPDTLAQRLAPCTQCHGEQGRAAPDGYHPRLAGKPAGYLYNQLLNFQDGRRHYGPMVQVLALLPPQHLRQMAEHFAALELPYPPPARSQANAATLLRGQELALRGDAARRLPACTACHGAQLMGTLPATPSLLGLPQDYLVAQLGAWANGQRKAHAPDCMAEVAERLQGPDLAAVAAWLAAQPVPQRAKAEPRPVAAPPLRCGSAP